MKFYRAASMLLLIPLLISSCRAKVSRSEGTPDSLPHTATIPSINPGIERCSMDDSIIVRGLHLIDSSEVRIPLAIERTSETEINKKGEIIKIENVKGDWFRLKFREKINGYNLAITVYPDTTHQKPTLADYQFSSTNDTFRVQIYNDEVNWNYYRESFDADEPDYLYGKTYPAVSDSCFIQGTEPFIRDTPFCFKDVDFDGEKELCFKTSGYNRHYFQVYKIIVGKPYLLRCRPFNNIVYSDYPDDIVANTTFDYSEHTIKVEEQFGCSSFWEDKYGVDSSSVDPTIRMKPISGVHDDYTWYGIDTQIREGNRLAGSEIYYNLLEESCTLVSKYSSADENTILLDSVIFSSAEKRKVLFVR